MYIDINIKANLFSKINNVINVMIVAKAMKSVPTNLFVNTMNYVCCPAGYHGSNGAALIIQSRQRLVISV